MVFVRWRPQTSKRKRAARLRGGGLQTSCFDLAFFLIPRNAASDAGLQVSKADRLYIGLTKPQPLLHNFHELFFGITKVEEGSQENCIPGLVDVAKSCNRTQRGSGTSRVRSISRIQSLSSALGETHAAQSLFIGYGFVLADVRFRTHFRQARATEFTIKGRQVRALKCLPASHHVRGIALNGGGGLKL